MKNKVTAVYFSPTGGTKLAVQRFAENFTDTVLVDNTLPQQRARQLAFTAEELVIVANPVYAGQMPQVSGLWRNLKGHDTPCVLLACYGNRHYDDTLAQMQSLLEAQGFKVIGAAAVVIPHIFSDVLGSNRPNDADASVLAEFADRIAAKLQQGKTEKLQLPGNPAPEIKAPVMVPKTLQLKQCNMCGTCTALCPVQAIDAVTLACDDKICISCMRCVKYCRTGARSFDNTKIAAWLESNFSSPRAIECFS